MAFLKLRKTLGSALKIGTEPETGDRILDLESGTICELKKTVPGMWLYPKCREHCCIYRVPNSIRRVNPEAYTPQLIILGPLHRSLITQALKSRGDITNTKSMGYLNMEQQKKFYLAEFAQKFEGEQTIDELRRTIENDEVMIRESYSESTAWIESPQFVGMILHDSVFIVEFILRCNYKGTQITWDPLMLEPCLKNTVNEDLKLLENQLPYFILEKLFGPIIPTFTRDKTFRELVKTHFECEGKIKERSKFRHFTDLIRLVHVDPLPEVYLEVYDKPIEHMQTADKLDSRGVKIEAVKEEFSLNVSFKKGCLKIPCLRVEDKVEMRLRNIMALEQCHYPYQAHVCNYVMFLDHLIDTHKDVEVLVEKEILKNLVGEDDSVAKMVNKLCLGILEVGSYYSDIAKRVNDYCRNPINQSLAILKRVYFSNMWTGTATVAATFLLLMTLIQTVTSIIQTIEK